jgi:hypothetical protein
LQPSLVFGCALLSFTVGMHGGYFWRTRRLIACEEDGVELWLGEVLQLWFEAVESAWRRWESDGTEWLKIREASGGS